jgi:hypothetical protein
MAVCRLASWDTHMSNETKMLPYRLYNLRSSLNFAPTPSGLSATMDV